jgi:D-sedoheptulose 7-phosphate isomerase
MLVQSDLQEDYDLINQKTEEIIIHTHSVINSYIGEIISTLQQLPVDKIGQIVNILNQARTDGRKVFIFGNGGSAATATHFACDLSKGAINKDYPRIKAISLCDNFSVASAWANDSHYDNIFAEQLENLVNAQDVVIGISGSGNSTNVLNGIKLAKDKGAITIGFTGFQGGKLAVIVDIPLVIPNRCMEQIEDIHLLVEHILTVCLRNSY